MQYINTQKNNYYNISNNPVIKFSILGSIIELYDWMLFIVFLPQITQAFFPQTGIFKGSIVAPLALMITFIITPFSSLIWGKIGDKKGRKEILSKSIYLMAIPSFVISIMPEYNTIDMLATICIIVCRILQGISCSGEIKTAKYLLSKTLKQEIIKK